MRPIRYLSALLSVILITSSANAVAASRLTLEQAIISAWENDPWLHGNQLKQRAVEMRSVAASSLPDPTVSVGVMNLPTDGLSFNQENMTMLTVGVAQMFPRGDSLKLKQQQLALESDVYPYLRENRRAQLKSAVSQVWLDAYLAQQTIELIKSDWALFEQMAEVAKASYGNALGKTRQQDVIRAQLEIVQLEDRLAEQQQNFDKAMAGLNQWMYRYNTQQTIPSIDFNATSESVLVSERRPDIPLPTDSDKKVVDLLPDQLAKKILTHPAVLAIAVKQDASVKAIELAEQAYKPQWAVNASYAYRDDMPSGNSRADFFSLGVSFDLPLFTENRQDKQVAASVSESEAVRTEKLVLLKQMVSELEKEFALLKRLQQRQAIYYEKLLIQTHEQAEASLTAYTNDDGDFAEVVRARIAELNARIAAMKIDVDILKAHARINYFLTASHATKTSAQRLDGEQP